MAIEIRDFEAERAAGGSSCETPRVQPRVHPDTLLAELVASWRAGACAAGRRLVSEVEGISSRLRDLRTDIVTIEASQVSRLGPKARDA